MSDDKEVGEKRARRLELLRRRIATLTGLEQVKAEGALIVEEREGQARDVEPVREPSPAPVEEPEPKPKPKKRRRRSKRRAEQERPSAPADAGGVAANAAHRSLDGSTDYPPVMSERPYKLTFEDGSERDVPSDGRTFGPN
jgi:hypothetical protein